MCVRQSLRKAFFVYLDSNRCRLISMSQELGIVGPSDGAGLEFTEYPIGSCLFILPYHVSFMPSCAAWLVRPALPRVTSLNFILTEFHFWHFQSQVIRSWGGGGGGRSGDWSPPYCWGFAVVVVVFGVWCGFFPIVKRACVRSTCSPWPQSWINDWRWPRLSQQRRKFTPIEKNSRWIALIIVASCHFHWAPPLLPTCTCTPGSAFCSHWQKVRIRLQMKCESQAYSMIIHVSSGHKQGGSSSNVYIFGVDNELSLCRTTNRYTT